MSASARFAPMTGELLARKGQASSFNFLATDRSSPDRRDVVVHELDVSTLPLRARNPSDANAAGGAASHPADAVEAANFFNERLAPGRRHSVSLSITDSEFERLGLIAVKKHVNKQQLLRLAIDHYLEKLADEYRSDCQCISAGGACCGGKPG